MRSPAGTHSDPTCSVIVCYTGSLCSVVLWDEEAGGGRVQLESGWHGGEVTAGIGIYTMLTRQVPAEIQVTGGLTLGRSLSPWISMGTWGGPEQTLLSVGRSRTHFSPFSGEGSRELEDRGRLGRVTKSLLNRSPCPHTLFGAPQKTNFCPRREVTIQRRLGQFDIKIKHSVVIFTSAKSFIPLRLLKTTRAASFDLPGVPNQVPSDSLAVSSWWSRMRKQSLYIWWLVAGASPDCFPND